MAVRRRKSMILDPSDENHAAWAPSSPTLSSLFARRSRSSRWPNERGLATRGEIPAHPDGHGRVKLSAAWLIERAGVARGYRIGRVGVSTRHALALVNLGGATTADVLALAATVRGAVFDAFGISLNVEPVCLGFCAPW